MERLPRLEGLLASDQGDVAFELQFGTDELGTPFVDVSVTARPLLVCQRTLETFEYPLSRTVRLGLIQSESEEAALPPGYEPFLVPQEPVRVTELVEDELILGLPLVPRKEGEHLDADFGPTDNEVEHDESPFAALQALKGEKDPDKNSD